METILFIIAMSFVAFWFIWGYNKVSSSHYIYFDNSDDANKFNAILKQIGYVMHVDSYVKEFDLVGNEIYNKNNYEYKPLLEIKKINPKDAMFVFTGKVSITFNLRMLKRMRKVIKIVKIKEEVSSYSISNEYTPIFE